jgi:hypothetical protein
MNTPKLGRLKRIRDIRKYWRREDADFTPWLAQEENIAVLGETIDLELEVQEQEANVGPFRADILCRNTIDDSLVLIENQLSRTDHTHLGQLITYAAGLEAVTLVWIVDNFAEEHRSALDWLNRITDESFHFFGLELELWQIENSPPAPKFNIVAKPNDWAKIVKEAGAGQRVTSPWQQMQKEFWAAFGQYLVHNKANFRPPPPSSRSWAGYGAGRSGTSMVLVLTQSTAWVLVQTDNKRRPGWLRMLQEDKDDIETELGFPLSWEHRTGQKWAIARATYDVDATDRHNWPTIMDWMHSTMDKMKTVFRSRIRSLPETP